MNLCACVLIKVLHFSTVQSPDAASNKSSPPLSVPRHTPTPLDTPQSLAERFSSSHTPSPADCLGKVSQLSMPSPFGGVATPERVGGNVQNLVDAMSSKFNSYAVPGGLPMGSSSIVKSVSVECK